MSETLTDSELLDVARLTLSYMLAYDADEEELLNGIKELREMLGPVSKHLRKEEGMGTFKLSNVWPPKGKE